MATTSHPDTDNKSPSNNMREVRTGRTLMTRTVLLPTKHESDETEVGGVSGPTSSGDIEILFIHGSCAAAQQYDSLVEALGELVLEQEEGTNQIRIKCHLFDHLGCGLSKHSPKDWNAYAASEQFLDLLTITKSILLPESEDGEESKSTKNKSLYIVGHSYGVSQAIQLANFFSSSDDDNSNHCYECIKGLILIGGACKGGPSALAKDGGHWIFSYLPMFVLQRMQPSLSDGFVQAAFHPSCDSKIREQATNDCNMNDMRFCKAFYRQQKYVTEDEVKKIKTNALVIHGKDDLVLPSNSSEHLKDLLSHDSSSLVEAHFIADSSHQVFMEHPKTVGTLIMDFISRT